MSERTVYGSVCENLREKYFQAFGSNIYDAQVSNTRLPTDLLSEDAKPIVLFQCVGHKFCYSPVF